MCMTYVHSKASCNQRSPTTSLLARRDREQKDFFSRVSFLEKYGSSIHLLYVHSERTESDAYTL